MPDENPNRPSNQPPPMPWEKGNHRLYSMAKLELEVCRDEFGRVFSFHRLADETDKATVMEWPAGGQEQIAFALLTEATRREAILGLLLRMTKEPDFIARFEAATEEEQAVLLSELADILRVQMNRTVTRLASVVVSEAVQMVRRETAPKAT